MCIRENKEDKEECEGRVSGCVKYVYKVEYLRHNKIIQMLLQLIAGRIELPQNALGDTFRLAPKRTRGCVKLTPSEADVLIISLPQTHIFRASNFTHSVPLNYQHQTHPKRSRHTHYITSTNTYSHFFLSFFFNKRGNCSRA